MPPIMQTEPRLKRLVSAFGGHPDWQNVWRLALGQLQNNPDRKLEKRRLALWLLQAGNPFLVLDCLETDRLQLPRRMQHLTRWLVRMLWRHQGKFTNKWNAEKHARPDLFDERPLVKETDNATIADVIASMLRREHRDSRALIAAWELAEADDVPPIVAEAKKNFLSEFEQLLAEQNKVALSLVAANDPRLPEPFNRTPQARAFAGNLPEQSNRPSNARAYGVRLNEFRSKYAQCPAETFLMGSDPTEGGDSDESPQHSVTLDAFQLHKTTITNRQFALFDPFHAQRFNDYAQYSAEPRCSAIYVNWHMAKLFCQWLTGTQTKLRYDLPTEAQWEYACRAGTTTPWSWGTEAELQKHAWYAENAEGRTHPVATSPSGLKAEPNKFGLYDMHGNVWEWCRDGKREYSLEPQRNPVGPEDQDYRVLRGGAYWDFTRNCRSAYRGWFQPTLSDGSTGFRVCVAAPQD